MEMAHGFHQRIYNPPYGEPARYQIFVPRSFSDTDSNPCILFLHGAAERGSDGVKPVMTGLGPAIRSRQADFPFVAIFPQSARGSWQAFSADAERALMMLEECMEPFHLDPERVVLTGISMGGYGAWSLALRYPDRWAAIVPICGGGDTSQAKRIVHVPCWCFHGALDDVVPVEETRDMVDALRAAGGDPMYTEYPDGGHDVWETAYATSELYDWMLQQRSKYSASRETPATEGSRN